jgi:2-polyprenyl-3-methyl-5-hydroxy-6-metoxy-1,4-benzoquinol methylase
MMQQLERRLLRMLQREALLPLARHRILEVGCGSGHFLREMAKWGAIPDRLTGIDLLEDRVTVARRL